MAVQPASLVLLVSSVFPNLLWYVETRAPLAALTFDDGPDALYTPQVLELLARHGAHATFFLIGERAEREPALVTRIRRAGHEVGNHWLRDAKTLFLTADAFSSGLLRTETALGLGGEGKLFRPPGGVIRPAHREIAARHGYRVVLGSSHPYDTIPPPRAYIRWLVLKNLRPGAIVVLHDSGGDRSNTLAALGDILAGASRRGLRFVSVSELVAAGHSAGLDGSSPSG